MKILVIETTLEILATDAIETTVLPELSPELSLTMQVKQHFIFCPSKANAWRLKTYHTTDKPKQCINTMQITEESNSAKATCRLTAEFNNLLQHFNSS